MTINNFSRERDGLVGYTFLVDRIIMICDLAIPHDDEIRETFIY